MKVCLILKELKSNTSYYYHQLSHLLLHIFSGKIGQKPQIQPAAFSMEEHIHSIRTWPTTLEATKRKPVWLDVMVCLMGPMLATSLTSLPFWLYIYFYFHLLLLLYFLFTTTGQSRWSPSRGISCFSLWLCKVLGEAFGCDLALCKSKLIDWLIAATRSFSSVESKSRNCLLMGGLGCKVHAFHDLFQQNEWHHFHFCRFQHLGSVGHYKTKIYNTLKGYCYMKLIEK